MLSIYDGDSTAEHRIVLTTMILKVYTCTTDAYAHRISLLTHRYVQSLSAATTSQWCDLMSRPAHLLCMIAGRFIDCPLYICVF